MVDINVMLVTQYEFTLSSTLVSAQRSGDSTAHFSPTCSERKYTLSVSNKLYALSGITTASRTMQSSWTKCRMSGLSRACAPAKLSVMQALGRGTCPATSADYNQNTLKALEYKVNLDMRNTMP